MLVSWTPSDGAKWYRIHYQREFRGRRSSETFWAGANDTSISITIQIQHYFVGRETYSVSVVAQFSTVLRSAEVGPVNFTLGMFICDLLHDTNHIATLCHVLIYRLVDDVGKRFQRYPCHWSTVHSPLFCQTAWYTHWHSNHRLAGSWRAARPFHSV